MNRIVIGLSHNTTVEDGDIFPFVYMSVSPFLSGGKPIESNKNGEESDESEIEENSHIKLARRIKFRAQLRNKVTRIG